MALAPVVEAAIDTIRPSAEAKDIRVLATIDGAGATVLDDPGRLQQLAWNLLSNAVKFTPRGGRVHVSLKRVDDHAEIVAASRPPCSPSSSTAVTAYGRGEDRVRVLEPGFQMHIVKPVEPTEIVAVIASLARRASR